MTTPVRIQRRRTKGYDMQAQSRAINGLPAVYVGRPTRWGNPCRTYSVRDRIYGLAFYQTHTAPKLDISDLRGRNLACWCRLCPAHQANGLPLGELCPDCHADVLLEIANGEGE